jgi:hypothetical protein
LFCFVLLTNCHKRERGRKRKVLLEENSPYRTPLCKLPLELCSQEKAPQIICTKEEEKREFAEEEKTGNRAKSLLFLRSIFGDLSFAKQTGLSGNRPKAYCWMRISAG